MDIVGQFFRVLCKKISTGREKLAPIDWHDWHAFATLLMNRGSCNHHFLEANHQDMKLVKSFPEEGVNPYFKILASFSWVVSLAARFSDCLKLWAFCLLQLLPLWTCCKILLLWVGCSLLAGASWAMPRNYCRFYLTHSTVVAQVKHYLYWLAIITDLVISVGVVAEGYCHDLIGELYFTVCNETLLSILLCEKSTMIHDFLVFWCWRDTSRLDVCSWHMLHCIALWYKWSAVTATMAKGSQNVLECIA